MAPETPKNEPYFIIRPDKLRFFDAIKLFVFRKRLTSFGFIETNYHEGLGDGDINPDWIAFLATVILKVLLAIRTPMQWLGYAIEFTLNLFSINGGVIGLIRNLVQAKVVIPNREAANYRSFIGHIDGRVDLYNRDSLVQYYPLMDPDLSKIDANIMDLAMMASKVAYENAAFVENAVTNHWKMKFVGFYNCWNKYNGEFGTQAFIFCDKAENADLIVVAFRGTEPFNSRDWATDVELSWLSMGKLGFVHLGFLKALGIQDELNYRTGFPKEYNGPDVLAYYTIREALKTLKKQHKKAKILVTGHSLGAALAAIFPALLSLHNQFDLLLSMYGVINFGQPRVGDAIFATYLQTMLISKYYRIVYRFDIVPRIPFDFPPIALFKHGGICIYYKGWYDGQIVIESPNLNYFNLRYFPEMYKAAFTDLFKALLLGQTQGEDFKESFASIWYRITFGILLPGGAFHSPRDYVNSVRLAKTTNKFDDL